INNDNLQQRIDYYKQFPSFKGVRHILQAEQKGFMTSNKFINGLKSILKSNLTYDVLITEGQFEEVLRMIKRLPERRLIIDHIGKPDIKNKSFSDWSAYMKQISSFDHVYVKLSGMVTEADWYNWETEDIKPYIDFCLDNVGPSRLMFGSDWPVCLLAGSYDRITKSIERCLAELSLDEQNQVMGKTASQFYEIS
ncbi:MAG: amidohydrolase family protein, partial [Bacteroidota bacterium]